MPEKLNVFIEVLTTITIVNALNFRYEYKRLIKYEFNNQGNCSRLHVRKKLQHTGSLRCKR